MTDFSAGELSLGMRLLACEICIYSRLFSILFLFRTVMDIYSKMVLVTMFENYFCSL